MRSWSIYWRWKPSVALRVGSIRGASITGREFPWKLRLIHRSRLDIRNDRTLKGHRSILIRERLLNLRGDVVTTRNYRPFPGSAFNPLVPRPQPRFPRPAAWYTAKLITASLSPFPFLYSTEPLLKQCLFISRFTRYAQLRDYNEQSRLMWPTLHSRFLYLM